MLKLEPPDFLTQYLQVAWEFAFLTSVKVMLFMPAHGELPTVERFWYEDPSPEVQGSMALKHKL